jgi:mono/diheme cytochrome c family protein
MLNAEVRRKVSLGVVMSAALACSAPIGLATTPKADIVRPGIAGGVVARQGDFATYCSACHGLDGKGRGPVAMELKTKPADLTRIAQRNGGTFDREAVYKRIEGLDMPASHGSAEMPVWGAWFVHQAVGEGVLLDDARTAATQATRRINNLVKYLETLQE